MHIPRRGHGTGNRSPFDGNCSIRPEALRGEAVSGQAADASAWIERLPVYHSAVGESRGNQRRLIAVFTGDRLRPLSKLAAQIRDVVYDEDCATGKMGSPPAQRIGEVTQIGRTIAKSLRLNEVLTEAIGLGHDLGHSAFGHAGEAALNKLVKGGFDHYRQSVRVVEVLENDGRGLNLTIEVRDGILKLGNIKHFILDECDKLLDSLGTC